MIKRSKILKIISSELEKEGAEKIAVIGSYAKGKNKNNRNIEIIVKFKKRKSLFEIVRIERELSGILGIKANLLTEKSISPYLRSSIKKDMMVIYR